MRCNEPAKTFTWNRHKHTQYKHSQGTESHQTKPKEHNCVTVGHQTSIKIKPQASIAFQITETKMEKMALWTPIDTHENNMNKQKKLTFSSELL